VRITQNSCEYCRELASRYNQSHARQTKHIINSPCISFAQDTNSKIFARHRNVVEKK